MSSVRLAAEGLLQRFLVVDDHRVFADALVMRLSAEPHIQEARAAYTLDEARSGVESLSPDVVLLDFQIAHESSLRLLDELGRSQSAPKVLMLSGLDDPETVVAALEAGAQGWVTKDSDYELLMRAVEEVHLGRMFLAPSVLEPVVHHLLAEARAHRRRPSFVDDLTSREMEVLRCLVAGMNRAEVARRLYLSVNTVRTHVQHLLRRADTHSTLALVALARDIGVRGIDEDVPSPPGVDPASGYQPRARHSGS